MRNLFILFFLCFAFTSRAADIALPPSIGPVNMVVLKVGVETTRNLGLVYVVIPNETHRFFYGDKVVGHTPPQNIYLGIDLATSGGAMMYDDFRRAFAAGDTLVVRCRIAPYASALTIKNDQPQELDPTKQLEKIQYWIPEMAWSVPN